MSAHPIPVAALDQPLAIVGTVGSGKTYAAKSAVEGLLAEGRRVLIVDPTGVWHGLRTRADGSAGFPVVIFGGEHADVPVSPDAGEALGQLLAEDRVAQAIVDVSEMSGGERTRFLTALFERLYAGRRLPRHLVLDEADEMAPQDPLPETRRLQGIVDKIVRRGRVRGFRPMLITQRPAVIHKNVLSQVATLVALRLTSPQDRKAVEGWVKGTADLDAAREVLASLPRLAVGEGWVWAPREDVLERVRFPAIGTLDTSASPDEDMAGGAPRAMAAVDVAAIRAALSASADVGKSAKSASGRLVPSADADALAAAEQRGYERGLVEGERRGETRGIGLGIARARAALEALRVDDQVAAAPPPAPRANGQTAPATPRASRPAKQGAAPAALGAERKPLAVLASVHPAGMTGAQWAVAAGFKRTGGTWQTYRSRLRAAGCVEARGDLWYATEGGLLALGEEPLPMPALGPELVAFWASRIPGVGPMLRHLAGTWPAPETREGLAGALGMAATGGTFGTYLSRLRAADLIEEPGRGLIKAADAVMRGAPDA